MSQTPCLKTKTAPTLQRPTERATQIVNVGIIESAQRARGIGFLGFKGSGPDEMVERVE